MIGWSEQQTLVKDMVRDFVEKEIVPHLDDLEYNGMPPYDILRKLFKTFGMDEMAGARFDKQIAREEASANGEAVEEKAKPDVVDGPPLAEALDAERTEEVIHLPYADGRRRAWLFEEGVVDSEVAGDAGYDLTVRMTRRQAARYAKL